MEMGLCQNVPYLKCLCCWGTPWGMVHVGSPVRDNGKGKQLEIFSRANMIWIASKLITIRIELSACFGTLSDCKEVNRSKFVSLLIGLPRVSPGMPSLLLTPLKVHWNCHGNLMEISSHHPCPVQVAWRWWSSPTALAPWKTATRSVWSKVDRPLERGWSGEQHQFFLSCGEPTYTSSIHIYIYTSLFICCIYSKNLYTFIPAAHPSLPSSTVVASLRWWKREPTKSCWSVEGPTSNWLNVSWMLANKAVEKSAAELLVNFPERRVVGNPSWLWKKRKISIHRWVFLQLGLSWMDVVLFFSLKKMVLYLEVS